MAAKRIPSYAVVWKKDDGLVVPGQLRLEGDGIRLAGAVAGKPEEHALSYRSLAGVRLGHGPDERLQGQPSMLVELRSLERYVIATIGGFGVLTELADEITAAMTLA
jgi:hypothetical protein